jgi:hypothetical protein
MERHVQVAALVNQVDPLVSGAGAVAVPHMPAMIDLNGLRRFCAGSVEIHGILPVGTVLLDFIDAFDDDAADRLRIRR